jgi:hypothetical protein
MLSHRTCVGLRPRRVYCTREGACAQGTASRSPRALLASTHRPQETCVPGVL